MRYNLYSYDKQGIPKVQMIWNDTDKQEITVYTDKVMTSLALCLSWTVRFRYNLWPKNQFGTKAMQ